jgi:SAM-dependent methyltransferase
MNEIRKLWWCLVWLAALAVPASAWDVPFVPTPPEVVRGMLELAEVGPDDVVYDLGSGDGRIVIMAAKEFGARGVGVDIDPQRIAEAQENARAAGVADKVKFIRSDLFDVDLRPATAVTLYLLPDVNLRLRPKLLKELRPGTPVVSHRFDMGDWRPEVERNIDGRTVYLWHVPPRTASKRAPPTTR